MKKLLASFVLILLLNGCYCIPVVFNFGTYSPTYSGKMDILGKKETNTKPTNEATKKESDKETVKDLIGGFK